MGFFDKTDIVWLLTLSTNSFTEWAVKYYSTDILQVGTLFSDEPLRM